MKTKFNTLNTLARARARATLAIVAASLLLAGAGFVSGCSSSSPDNRIRKNQELFNSLPPEAQASIRAGKVALGFTPDMVLLALGEPDRRYTRTNEQGSSEVWAYAARSTTPALSIGFGLGMGLGGRVGTTIGVTSGVGDRADDTARIIFASGKVSTVEQATSR